MQYRRQIHHIIEITICYCRFETWIILQIRNVYKICGDDRIDLLVDVLHLKTHAPREYEI